MKSPVEERSLSKEDILLEGWRAQCRHAAYGIVPDSTVKDKKDKIIVDEDP